MPVGRARTQARGTSVSSLVNFVDAISRSPALRALLIISMLLISLVLLSRSQKLVSPGATSMVKRLFNHRFVQGVSSTHTHSKTVQASLEQDNEAASLLQKKLHKHDAEAHEHGVHSKVATAPVSLLPPYAKHNSFYHQRSYQCKPTHNLNYTWPTIVLPDGSKQASDGGRVATKLLETYQIGSTQPNERAFSTANRIEYGPWTMKYPKFIKEEHKKWFATYQIATWRRDSGCGNEYGLLHFCEPSYVNGGVSYVKGATVSESGMGHDCGPNGNLNTLMENGKYHPVTKEVDTLYWAVIPATWTFQHWMENTLPKIAAAMEFFPDFLLWKNVSAVQELLLDRYPIIQKIYEHIGWNVFDDRSGSISTKQMMYSCVTPPLHPYLWQQAQQHVLRVKPRPIEERNKIVYCHRNPKRTENAGRLVNNHADVLRVLRDQTGFQVDVFDHTLYPSITDLLNYFSDVRLLVGPHGGCMTNVVFLGCNSAVIELFPLVGGIAPPVGHPAMMMYMQSVFLEQNYYMLPVSTPDSQGNIDVPIDELTQLVQLAIKDTTT